MNHTPVQFESHGYWLQTNVCVATNTEKDETQMRLVNKEWYRAGRPVAVCLIGLACALISYAQAFSTTAVQGTVYLADGRPGAGTLQLSWPAFTTANDQAVAAGRTTVAIGADGFVSVNLAPNVGATPGGLYYTAVYYMSNGATSTEYWVVPSGAQASIAQVRAQVMPAAQAVHAVNKAYVDQAIQSLSQNFLAAAGGTLNSPLFLSEDPAQAMEAADKHYVDSVFSQAVPWSTVKDGSNNWVLNSSAGGVDSFKAYQSINSGDTYINASNSSGMVRVNYEAGAGTGFNIYGGNSGTLYAGFTGSTSIEFPGLAASNGHNCVQIDDAGFITNTGLPCGSGSGTVNNGVTGQIAYYNGSGAALSGVNAVPVSAGGTGASSAGAALASLGAASLVSASTQTFAGPINFGSQSAASTTVSNLLGTNVLSLTNQSGSTPQAQFTNSVTGATGQTFLFVPPQIAGGTSTSSPSATTPLNSAVRVLDVRGANCMDQYGTFSYGDRSLCIYARETDQDSGAATTNHADFDLGYESASGGVYSSNSLGTGVKSNRAIQNLYGGFRSVAQNWGINMMLEGFTGGELDSYSSYIEDFGGYLGYGQESPTSFRAQQYTGTVNDGAGGVFQATVTGVSGNTVSFSTSDQNVRTIGEARFFRDLTNPYSTGTISAVSCSGGTPNTCTVTGSGTTWTSIAGFVGTHTTWSDLAHGGPILSSNLALCFTPNANNGHDWCVPITAGVSDTSLTVNLYEVGTAQNIGWLGPTSGNYVIYHAAWPTGVSLPGKTFTAGDVSGMTSGHSIDQVEAYNPSFLGGLILQSRDIGRPYYGGGWAVENYSPANSPAFNYGYEVAGNYLAALRIDAYGAYAPNSAIYDSQRGGGTFIDDTSPASTTPFNFYQYTDSGSTIRFPITFNPNTASGNVGMCFYASFCISPAGVITNFVTNTWTGSGSGTMLIQPGSGSGYSLVVKNPAGTVNTLIVDSAGNGSFSGQGSAASFTTAGTSTATGGFQTTDWLIYESGGSGYWRDRANSKQAFSVTPNTEAVAFTGPISAPNLPLSGTTASIGGSALTAGNCASGTVSVTGATTSMGVVATPATYPGDAFVWKGYVSGAGTVTVKVCTNLAAGGTPAASVYNVRVIQ